jgi:hypothetical protein
MHYVHLYFLPQTEAVLSGKWKGDGMTQTLSAAIA